ncbi:hypothetical protein HY086_03985 [Candidatus Gottesmanbacteria bacterium]|nr:hypothetical protein [Candidatus Gottesmanbacteria bacterium]
MKRQITHTLFFILVLIAGGLIASVVRTYPQSKETFRKLPEREKYRILKRMIAQKGAVAAWKFINSAYDEKYESTFDTHTIAHFMGGKIYDEKGIDGIVDCTPLFINGCYHGIAERVLAKNLNALSIMKHACEGLRRISVDAYTGCIHGLGHGFTSRFQHPNLREALSLCDQFKEYQRWCQGGVFMEYAVGESTSPYRLNEDKATNQLSLCYQLRATYWFSCADRILGTLTKLYSFTYQGLVGVCDSQKDPTMRIDCFAAFGHLISARSKGNLSVIRERCGTLDDSASHAACVVNGLEEKVMAQKGNWEEAIPTCKDLLQPFQTDCQNVIRAAMHLIGQ